MGLFRYVDASALIQNLTVSGEIIPDGSRSAVGGIAGHNAGKIQNCFFDGTVSGSDDVGGIAGINAITGIIDGCHSKGVITGDHRVGGVVGNNLGVVRSCNNRSGVNTTAEENQVKLSDISLETITGSESVSKLIKSRCTGANGTGSPASEVYSTARIAAILPDSKNKIAFFIFRYTFLPFTTA